MEDTMYSSIPGGYGAFIDDSTEALDVPIKPECDFGNKELMMYKQQEGYSLVTTKKQSHCSIPIPTKLDDYSSGNMCDYKVAFTSTISESDKLVEDFENKKIKRTYSALLDERNLLDYRLLTPNREPSATLLYPNIVST